MLAHARDGHPKQTRHSRAEATETRHDQSADRWSSIKRTSLMNVWPCHRDGVYRTAAPAAEWR